MKSNFSNIRETPNKKQITSPESSLVWSDGSYPETISSVSQEKPKDIVKSTINYEEGTGKRRTKIIVISVVTALILGIIAMIVLFVVLLKSKDTTETSTAAGSIDSYSSTTAATNSAIIYDVGNGGASGDPPCSSYTVVNDPVRNVNTSGIGGTCDNGPLFNTSIGGRWIRFMGIGGTIIPLESAGTSHCGSFLTGWFNGTLPSITQTVVSAEICFQMSFGSSCGLVPNAAVVNCGSFYAYFLPPVIICNTRYCTV